MSDLVQRARKAADYADDHYPEVGAVPTDLVREMADRIEELERQLIEAEKYNGWHQQACLRIEELERRWIEAEGARGRALLDCMSRTRREALEEAVRVAIATTKAPPQRNAKDQWREQIGEECATAIRALMEKGNE